MLHRVLKNNIMSEDYLYIITVDQLLDNIYMLLSTWLSNVNNDDWRRFDLSNTNVETNTKYSLNSVDCVIVDMNISFVSNNTKVSVDPKGYMCLNIHSQISSLVAKYIGLQKYWNKPISNYSQLHDLYRAIIYNINVISFEAPFKPVAELIRMTNEIKEKVDSMLYERLPNDEYTIKS